MGRLEKQIIIGALVLVGVLLSVVVIKGLKPRGGNAVDAPPLMVGAGGAINIPLDIPLSPQKPVQKPTNWPVEPKPIENLIDEIDLTPVAPPVTKSKPQKLPVVQVPPVRSYTIRSGDTLSEIAQQQMGSSKPSMIERILAVNPGVTAENIRPGDVLILPARGSNKVGISNAAAKPSGAAQIASAGVRKHTITSGDSLWKIARTYYGLGGEEKGIARIVAANAQLSAGKNSVLKIGKVLTIPE
jgi:nucleoid-associated protein YgaU